MLTIGPPNDKYEQKADKVASQVVQQVNGTISHTQEQSVHRQQEQEEELRTEPNLERSPNLKGDTSKLG